MGKKRSKPSVVDPIMVTTVSRWGTKAQGKLNERERGYKNRIFELETSLNAIVEDTNKALRETEASRDRLQGMLDAVMSTYTLESLRCVCSLPVRSAIDLGVYESLRVLTRWLADLESPQLRGNVTTAIMLASLDKVARVPATSPPVSGITKVLPDHDDADSVDDLFARGVDVHLERMDDHYYWLGITPMIGGETVHIDISQEKTKLMRARIRK